MNNQAIEALQQEVGLWKQIVAGEQQCHGTANSPLCLLYHVAVEDPKQKCKHCPVYESTSKQFCEDTPYYDYFLKPTKKSAEEHIKFLQSLLPEA